MATKAESIDSFKTKITTLLMNLANEPLVVFYGILPFILRKELHANVFQLSFFIMLRPILSSLSFFWGITLNYSQKPNLLRNTLFSWAIARLPFLFFPFTNNLYYFLFASAIYQLFHKAGLPAWMEIIKRNIKDNNNRYQIFSTFSAYIFIESIILGLFIGNFLDKSNSNWKIIFFYAALLSLSSLFFQIKIKVPLENNQKINPRKNFFTPFKDIFELLQKNKDFANFQIIFMIGGFALMLITPALYIFANDVLNLTHQGIANARLILMGLGFTSTSFIWKKLIIKKSINTLALWMISCFGIYAFFLVLSIYSHIFFYIAFFCYGMAQAGSTFLWNLSSILFSKNQNSILYTSTNLLFLLIRGLIAPFLGSLLCYFIGATMVLYIGLFILLYGIFIAYKINIKTQSYDLESA